MMHCNFLNILASVEGVFASFITVFGNVSKLIVKLLRLPLRPSSTFLFVSAIDFQVVEVVYLHYLRIFSSLKCILYSHLLLLFVWRLSLCYV